MNIYAIYTDAGGEKQNILLTSDFIRNKGTITLESYNLTVDNPAVLRITGTGNPGYLFSWYSKGEGDYRLIPIEIY